MKKINFKEKCQNFWNKAHASISKNFDTLFVIIAFLVSGCILWDLFHQGTYQWIIGHEGVHYLLRSIFFHNSICGGDFLPRWSTEMLSGYGYPFFMFYGNGTFFFAEIIRFVGSGLSLEVFCSDSYIQTPTIPNPHALDILSINKAWNILTFLSYFFSGIGMFLLMKQFVSKIPAFCAALVFMFFPYHIGEIFMRGDVAETVAAYTTIVWAFYFGVRFIREQSVIFLVISAAFLAATIFTHTVSGLMWLPIFAAFAFWFAWIEQVPKKIYTWLFIGGLLSLALAAFYFLPAMFQKELVHIERLFHSPFLPELHRNNNILSLQYDMHYMVNSPYGFTKVPALSFGIVILAFSAVFFLFSKNLNLKHKKFLGFWVVVFYLGVLLNTDLNKDLVPKLGATQSQQMEAGLKSFFTSKLEEGAVTEITDQERAEGKIGVTRQDLNVVIPMAGKYIQDYVYGKVNSINNQKDLDKVIKKAHYYVENGSWKSVDVSLKNTCEREDQVHPKTGELLLERRDLISAFWAKTPLACALQFAWRLQVWFAFAIAIFAGFLAQSFITVQTSRFALVGLFASVIWAANIPYLKETSWSADNYEKYKKSYYHSGDLHKILKHEHAPAYTSVVENEYAIDTIPEEFHDSISKAPNPADLTKLHQTAGGILTINNYKKTATTFEYDISLDTAQSLWIEHFYFPGWKVYTSQYDLPFQEITLELNQNGLISFNAPTGDTKVKIEFTKVTVVKIAEGVSTLAFFISMLALVFRKRINKKFFNKTASSKNPPQKPKKTTTKPTTKTTGKKEETKSVKTKKTTAKKSAEKKENTTKKSPVKKTTAKPTTKTTGKKEATKSVKTKKTTTKKSAEK